MIGKIRTFLELWSEQTPRALTNTSLLVAETDGHMHVVSMDQVNNSLQGVTVVAGRQGTYRSLRLASPNNIGASERVDWPSSERDTDTMWSGLNASRIYPPNDATLIRIFIYSPSATVSIGRNNEVTPSLGTGTGYFFTKMIDHSAGDFYEVYGTDGTGMGSEGFLELEILEQLA